MSQSFHLFTSLRYDRSLTHIPDRNLSHVAGWNSSTSSPFYMLDLHRDRVLRAARHWNWHRAVEALEGDAGLRRLADFLAASLPPPRGEEETQQLRVKVTVSEDGVLGCETSTATQTPLENLFPVRLPEPGTVAGGGDGGGSGLPSKEVVYEVVLDPARTERSEYTHFKTSQRMWYDEARQRARIKLGDLKEVLIVGEDGEVMEGSTTTPYFWRNGRWVTPPVSSRYSSADGSGGNDGTTRRWALQR